MRLMHILQRGEISGQLVLLPDGITGITTFHRAVEVVPMIQDAEVVACCSVISTLLLKATLFDMLYKVVHTVKETCPPAEATTAVRRLPCSMYE